MLNWKYCCLDAAFKYEVMETTFKNIISVLKCSSVKYDSLETDSGGVILVVPEYGRVLGVWPDRKLPTPYWINLSFLTGTQEQADWDNPGGHRIWIAPEKEFFISDIRRPFETYKVPKVIDPGRWNYFANSSEISFSCDVRLHAFRSQRDILLNIKRVIRPLSIDAVSDMIPLEVGSCQCAAYEEELELICYDELKVGLWSLIQVPLGGEMVVPVKSGGKVTEFFGDGSCYITGDEKFVKIKYDRHCRRDFKLGFGLSSVEDVVYYRRDISRDHSCLITQKFTTSDGGEYVDMPWNSDVDNGSVVQSFCGGTYGFGEIEVHHPVKQNVAGCYVSKGSSVVLSVIFNLTKDN